LSALSRKVVALAVTITNTISRFCVVVPREREKEKILPKKKKNNNSITIRARRLRTSIIHSGV